MIPMHSPGSILQQGLIDVGKLKPASSTTWPSFASGNVPDTPDDLVFLGESSAILGGSYMIDGTTIVKPGVQIMVRSRVYADGWAKITDVTTAMLIRNPGHSSNFTMRRIVVKGVAYLMHRVKLTSGPVSLGQEKEGQRRFIFTVNVMLSLTLAP